MVSVILVSNQNNNSEELLSIIPARLNVKGLGWIMKVKDSILDSIIEK